MYGVLASGYADWPIIKQLAWLMGKVMNGIYNFLDGVFGIQNIGICIILFTIVVYTLMIPLTIKQQKWSKMQSVMGPEMQKIQKKYANRRDQASMLKQQEELNILYEKYGTSPTGGCLPMLIQLPLLFSLYPVIQNIPKYVNGVKELYMPVVNQIMATPGYQKIMEAIGSQKPVFLSPDKFHYDQADTLVNVLYRFQDTWETLVDKMPSVANIVADTQETMSHLNSFMGINIGETPWTMLMASISAFSIIGIILAIIIPVMAGLTQFLSVKLQPQPETDPNNAMAGQMKAMTYTMPLISVFMGFTLPAGLGLYWAISAVVRCIQQIGINKYLNKKGVDKIIEENQKKAAKKREKKGTSAKEINRMATTSTRNVEPTKRKSTMTEAERQKKLEQAAKYNKNAKAGSLASKANLVSRYNNGQNSNDK